MNRRRAGEGKESTETVLYSRLRDGGSEASWAWHTGLRNQLKPQGPWRKKRTGEGEQSWRRRGFRVKAERRVVDSDSPRSSRGAPRASSSCSNEMQCKRKE